MHKITGFLAFFLFASAVGQSARAEPLPSDSLQVDGRYRSFLYFVPEGLGKDPSLVFVMHGSGGSAEGLRNQTGHAFEDLAAERGATIIVYPQGYENHWNDCRARASYLANTEDVDELAFFSGMIDYFAKRFKVDPASVFATGISNGGHMCYKLAYEMPERFKGIAAFVANLPQSAGNDCQPRGIPTDIMIINGTEDPINPNDGGWVVIRGDSTRGEVLSTEQTTEYWTSLLPCKPVIEEIRYPDLVPGDGTQVEHVKYRCPESGQRVELVRVVNGGHTIPLLNAPPIPEEYQAMLGLQNSDLSSPALVLDFFESL